MRKDVVLDAFASGMYVQAPASLKTEVADIRTGEDGTVYASAGEAVRQQIKNVSSASSGGGLTADVKQALLNCFANVAWINGNGQTYYAALQNALYPPANLQSISAVYTQRGAVYDTASLDSLKPNLVVTAKYSDGTAETVTAYTLSGQLVEGTSTITVAFGGKTATFDVTVSVFSTAPRIASYDKTLQVDGTEYSLSGSCLTEPYEYTLDIDAFRKTQYYDAENNYNTTNGDIFLVKYCFPNTSAIAFGSRGKSCAYDTSDALVTHASTVRDAPERGWIAARYTTGFFTLADNKLKFIFNLTTADVDDSYAYWATPISGVLPVGVRDGDIIFAGKNTSYYGKTNINN